MQILAGLVAFIMCLIALLHYYWAFGGTYGIHAAIPVKDGAPAFTPGKVLTFMVACLVAGLAVLAIQLVHPWPFAEAYAPYIGYFVSIVFIVRAIGDFKHVGLFKKVYNSPFSTLDTRYFSPLCLFLGVAFAVLSRYGA